MLLPLALLLSACGSGTPIDPPAGNAAPAETERPTDAPNVSNAAEPPALPAGTPTPPPPVTPLPAAPRPAADKPDYRAIGTEPFWAVTIRGDVATLERPDHPAQRARVTRTDHDSAIDWTGDGLSLRIAPGPCSDGMSDAVWSDRVQVATATGTLKGCGGTRGPSDD